LGLNRLALRCFLPEDPSNKAPANEMIVPLYQGTCCQCTILIHETVVCQGLKIMVVPEFQFM